MKKAKYILFLIVFLSIVGWGPFFFSSSNSSINNNEVGSTAWIEKKSQVIHAQASNLDMQILKLSLKAFSKARKKGYDDKQLLTIIDYSKPSSERRLWVVDLKKEKVLFNTWVSHGKNSGEANATSFSNQPGSLKSSFGVFLTDTQAYVGNNGYSLRMMGLESGVNSNAYSRDIVFHGAWYATPEVAKKYGQLGRSWGCPAVDETLAKPLIDTIKDNTLVFAYYPDRKWLWTSPFLVS
jgi:hypothetical protein